MDHENYATFASNAQELTPSIDVILPDTVHHTKKRLQWTYFEITWQHGIPSQSCTKITANDIFLCLWFHDVNQIRRPMYSFPSVQMAIHPIDLHAHSLRQDFFEFVGVSPDYAVRAQML